MSDIKLSQGELIFNSEDLELVSNEESIIQDIQIKLSTTKTSLFYDHDFGSDTLLFIQQNHNDETIAQLKQHIYIALKEDNRINSDTIQISTKIHENSLFVSISCQTLDNIPLFTEVQL